EPGKVSGKVTKSADSTPIQGISVCASPVHYELGVFACASTDASGNYTITGLYEDEYRISFGGGNGYVSEYYDDAGSFSNATLIQVTNAATKSSVNAALASAGQITGKVINAVGKAALSGVQVCAS